MKTSSNGIKFIEREEGCILQAYDDINDKVVQPGQTVKGTLTIGTGHTTAAGPPKVTIGQKITQADADAILATDLAAVEKDVNNLVKVSLTQNQYDMLVSFQFNTGALGRSTLLKKLNAKDYTGAADAFLNWSKGNGNPTLLLPRRQRERAVFLTPDIKSSAGPAATAVIVAGGVVAAAAHPVVHSHPLFWPIVIGVGVTAIVVGLLIHFFKKGS